MPAAPAFADAPLGRLDHSPHELRGRHCHDAPFVAVVLAGGYQEAGDEGRFNVRPGDTLLHHAFESHLDRAEASGARVLILDLPPALSKMTQIRGTVRDPDQLVRLAENDTQDALAQLVQDFIPAAPTTLDWPDMLARDLRGGEPVALAIWAETIGLRPETISRGFRMAYGCTPKSYRANARARAAFVAIRTSREPIAAIAHRLHFTDQTHMTHAVARLTGRTPGRWRQRQLDTIPA